MTNAMIKQLSVHYLNKYTRIMKRFLIVCFLFLGFSISVLSQEAIEVTGIVVDNTNEPLIGVNISIKDAPGLGTVTDIDGRYKVRVNTYQHLIFSYLGFEKQERSEEHTSELQSRPHLVCRLLLEKK